MIIECGHCGAPLDIKQGERRTKCAYCGTQNNVASTRTVAFETPPGWRPPPQWVPPPNFAADSAKALTYHATKAVKTVISLIAGIIMFGVVMAAVSVFVISQKTATISTDIAQTMQRSIGGEGNAASEHVNKALQDMQKRLAESGIKGVPLVPGGGQNQLSLLTNAGVEQTLSDYKKALGVSALKVSRMTFHEGHSSMEAQSPANPKHMDRYGYHSGVVSAPDPQRLSDSDKKNLESLLFDPEKTALSKLDELKAETMSKLGYEEAKVTHVIVERRRGKTEILVYASNPRDSGYVRFSDSGKVVRAYK